MRRASAEARERTVDGPRPVLFTPEEKAALWERYRDDYEDLVR